MDPRPEPAKNSAPPDLRSRVRAAAASRLYLRDYRDLTLHGGLGSDGSLNLLPVFSGLGTKGINAGAFRDQSVGFWRGGPLPKVCEEIGLSLGQPSWYQVRYPALTGSLPLPSPAVIDHLLRSPDDAVMSQQVARTQLLKCAAAPCWRVYRMLGEALSLERQVGAALLGKEKEYSGLLTGPFRRILEALQELHAAIDQAEARRQFVVMDTEELGFALDLARQHQAPGAAWTETTKWPRFYQHMTQWGDRIRLALATPNARITAADHSDRRGPRGEGHAQGTKWAVVADVSAAAVLGFARDIEAAQGQGVIWPEGISVTRDLAGNDYHWMGAIELAQPRSYRFVAAIGLAWRTIAQRAMERAFYHQTELPLPELARVWSRRFAADSALATLLDQLPSRPIAEGGALIVRTEMTEAAVARKVPAGAPDSTPVAAPDSTSAAARSPSFVRVDVAVVKPKVATLRTVSRAKKFPNLADQYFFYSSTEHGLLPGGPAGVPGFYADEAEQVHWPHGRVWQAVDLVKTFAADPTLLLCPEALFNGFLRLPSEKWEQLGLTAGHKPEGPVSGTSAPSWSQVHDWFLGATPWSTLPLRTRKATLYGDPSSSTWPMTVVDGGIAAADVRLSVRFEAADGDLGQPGLVSFSKLIEVFSRAAASAGESQAELSRLLAEFGEKLRFKARPYFEVDGRTIEEAEWFAAVKSKAGYYRLSSGLMIDAATFLSKTDQFILRQRVYAKFQRLRLGDIWTAQRQVMAESAAKLSPDEYIRQLSLRISPVLRELDAAALEPLTRRLVTGHLPDLAAVLRPYQATGMAWAYLRFHLGFGVCLADDMGLGKTLQAIALLRTLRDPEKPSLVVMPKTLLHNWRRELERFAPGLKVAVYGEVTDAETADVWLVTYPRLRLEQASLCQRQWNVVVLDEAQAIKNADTQVADAANQLTTRYRLAMTGTPVENRAAELWSIINWLNPGYLGGQADFSGYTTLARSSEQKLALMAPLRESLDPLLLRRTKSDPRIALGLPDKIFQDLRCDLSPEQTALYEAVIETVLAEDSMGLKAFARRAVFLKAILHLKQICLHPELFYGDQEADEVVADIDVVTLAATKKLRQLVAKRLRQGAAAAGAANDAQWLARSAKLVVVRDLVEALREESRGVLIFTQYLGAAAILRRALGHTQHEEIPFIHGGLAAAERLQIVDEFNERCRGRRAQDACPILLLSLKAGGTGLNLTGADRVIHFDRWWNPAVEDQASDRVHRIGQDRSVFIHTVTCQGTIEEAIGSMFVEKRQLADDLLGAAAASDVGEMLRSRDGFLDLVDPQRIFSARLNSAVAKLARHEQQPGNLIQ